MPALGEILESERKKDFEQIVGFYKSFSIDDKCFQRDYLDLLNEVHKLAVGVDILSSRIENIPQYAMPYLLQIKSDAIQIMSLIMVGNERGLKLFERSLIENTFRYIFYYHHEIEHELLQFDAGTYKSFKLLREYLKNHPYFIDNPTINISIGELHGKYSELSRVIHAGVVSQASIIDNIASLHQPFSDIKNEKKVFDTIGQNVMYLLLYFHNKDLSLTADERHIVMLLLTQDQIKQVSKLI